VGPQPFQSILSQGHAVAFLVLGFEAGHDNPSFLHFYIRPIQPLYRRSPDSAEEREHEIGNNLRIGGSEYAKERGRTFALENFLMFVDGQWIKVKVDERGSYERVIP
jgi:hypothetical protein